jgi:hypothetical protein
MVVVIRMGKGDLIMFPSYHVHPEAYFQVLESRVIYCEYTKPCDARSNAFLVVNGCSKSFLGCFWVGIRAVFGVLGYRKSFKLNLAYCYIVHWRLGKAVGFTVP